MNVRTVGDDGDRNNNSNGNAMTWNDWPLAKTLEEKRAENEKNPMKNLWLPFVRWCWVWEWASERMYTFYYLLGFILFY